jgi:hypothetical protein
MVRWLAVLVLGIAVGAAAILLADPGTSEPRVLVTPAAASSADASSAAAAGGTTALNGQHVHGVKAGDIAAESLPDEPLDAATRAELAAQLTAARDVAMRYPTAADATAAGYRLAGGFAPGSGAHFVAVSAGGLSGAGVVEPERVNSLIYDGTNPTSKIVGLMYYGMGESPQGFAGPNDHWHRHSNVCINYTATGLDVPFPADADVTEAQCQEAGGSLLKTTGYMVHAWVVPGWESPLGVFSHDNPNVRCADGTYQTDKAGFCQGT